MSNPLIFSFSFSRILLFCFLMFALPNISTATGTPGALNDTGQTQCYDNSGGVVACSSSNQDGRYGRDAAAVAGQLAKTGGGAAGFDFTKIANNGNGLSSSVTLGANPGDWACTRDNVTGLTWEVKTADGGMRDLNHTYTWSDAANYAASVNAVGLCGFNDWRVPTVKELQGIVHAGTSSPSIDTTYFPNTLSNWYWTSTTYTPVPDDAWDVLFNVGYVDYLGKGSNVDVPGVRLVRGGQWLDSFVDNADGTVTHSPTNLMWAKCSVGQIYNGGQCTGSASYLSWGSALDAARNSSLAGHSDWRLPTYKELASLVDYSQSGPAINSTYFPNTPSEWYWTSTSYTSDPAYAWNVYFDNGYVHYNDKGYNFDVRLVRGGQCFDSLGGACNSATLTVSKTGLGTVTSNPSGINCGSDCAEVYAPGASVTLTASAASGSTFTGWSGSGCSGTGTCTVAMNAAKTVTATFTRITYALTLNKSGAGSGTVTSSPSGISCGTGCTTAVRSYNGGTGVTLTASVASGSTFTGWSGSGCAGTGTCTVTMSAAKTVTAVFKANQTIGAISFSSASLVVGGTTTASATATSTLGVTFSSSTPSVCTVNGRTVTGVAAGTCTIAANQAGNANYNAAPRVTRNLTVTTPTPDFVVTGVTFTPVSPTANSTFSINVTVRNQGTAAGDGGQLTLWTNQADYQNCGTPGDRSLAIGTLAVGASRVLTVSNLAAGSAGTKTLRTFVDSDCAMLESNPTNNQGTRTYTVVPPPAPDLVVTAITLTPASPTANATFSAMVTVRNQGTTAAASGAKLVIWANQPTDQSCGANGNNSAILGALLNGVERNVNFTGLSAGSAGSKALRVFVDSNCLINESTDTNNQRTLIYTVR
ncbi:conserved exported hypothetical protein [Gammaproteobacteria bacterium]